MYQFFIVRHGKIDEVECHNDKQGSIQTIYQSKDHRLIMRLCAALKNANKRQLFLVMHGWTGRTDAAELRRLSDILNNGEMFYEQSSNTVYGVQQVYQAFKGNPKENGGIFRNYLDRRIHNGSLSRTIPLVESKGRAYVGRFV